jgi:hypothetical protein
MRTVAAGFDAAAPPLAVPAAPASAAAHWPQKSNPGGFSNEQSGQISTSAVRHFPQNRMPAGLSNSHFEQRIEAPRFSQADARVSPELATKETIVDAAKP